MGTISKTKNNKYRARIRLGSLRNNALTKTFSSRKLAENIAKKMNQMKSLHQYGFDQDRKA